MKKFKVALAQMDIKLGDKEANLEVIAKLVSQASEKEADFVCLPEYAAVGSVLERFTELAESVPGYFTDRLGMLAKANGVYLIASLPEKSNREIYNTAVMVGPCGTLLTSYRKRHLFLDERKFIKMGGEYSVVDTEFGRVGLLVCYDAVFPEVARSTSLLGAEIIFVPANWPVPFLAQWKLATNARALDNQIWLVAVNRIGKDKQFTYFGNSRVVNPYGEAVAECGVAEEIQVVEIDETVGEGFKKIVNFLADRNPND